MTRNIKYYCSWTSRGGVVHHSVDVWDDLAKWSWDLARDYKFEDKLYPAATPARYVIDRAENGYYVVDTWSDEDIATFDDADTATEYVRWKNSRKA